MRRLPQRIVVYPKDVEIITGRRRSAAAKLLRQIKQALGKAKHHYITIAEFSFYTGISEEIIRNFM